MQSTTSLWWPLQCWALVCLAFVSLSCAPPPRRAAPPADPKPTHERLVAALQASGEVEYAAMITGAGDYVLTEEALDGMSEHKLYRVTLTRSDHPTSFWIAAPLDGRTDLILSQHLAGIHNFLLHEATLQGLPSADLVKLFFELYRDQGTHASIAPLPPSLVVRNDKGLQIVLQVVEGPVLKTWTVGLPVEGFPNLTVESRVLPPQGSAD